MDIVFFDGSAFETWNPETLARDGAGGSEFMLADISRGLAALGHTVRVYVKCDGIDGVYDGVDWRPISRMVEERACDVLVAWRTPEVIGSSYLVSPKTIVFVATDSHYGAARLPDDKAGLVDKFVVMSNWHREQFLSVHTNVDRAKVAVIRTGVDHALFARISMSATTPRGGDLIHTSAPNRSLARAMRAMPKIREAEPGTMLRVLHGFLTLRMFAESRGDSGMMADLDALERAAQTTGGVVYFNRVNREGVYRELLYSRAWVYPTHVAETSCIAAQEAQAAGCHIVAVALGALPETIGMAGKLLPHDFTDDQYVEAVVAQLRSHRTPHDLQTAALNRVPSIGEMVRNYEALMVATLSSAPSSAMLLPSPEPLQQALVAESGAICLAMIVRDEAHIIGEAIRRVLPLIDCWYIIDTGSLDDTREIISKTLETKPGLLVDREWVSFKHNRTGLIKEATALVSGWLLLLDADCLVETALTGETLRAKLAEWGADQLLALGRAGITQYDKLFLIRTGLDWFYDIPTHEWLYCNGPMRHARLDSVTIHETAMGARRQKGKKFVEDIALLTEYLMDPAVPHRPRATFYLAQSYRDHGDQQKAFGVYAERAQMTAGSPEERYIAMLEAGRAAANLGLLESVVRAYYEEATKLRPGRAEAHYELGRRHRFKGEYDTAVPHLRRAAALAIPTDSLFIGVDVYEWKAKEELAVALSWLDVVEARREAASLFREVLLSGKLPAGDEERVRQNEEMVRGIVERAEAQGSLPAKERVTIVSPPSEQMPITRALDDVALLLFAGFLDMGCEAHLSTVCVEGTKNIVIGAHVQGWDPGLTKDAIIYQTEVWSSPWWQNPGFVERLLGRQVWDYSDENARHYHGRLGLTLPHVVPLGYSERFLPTGPMSEEQPIDVLFVGSPCDRRARVIEQLAQRGLRVAAPVGVFGADRERFVRQAKVVVNIHYYPEAPYEQARLVPLLSRGVAIVSEVSPGDDWIGAAILHKVPYEHLASECELLVRNAELRMNAGAHGLATVKKHPMSLALLRAQPFGAPSATPRVETTVPPLHVPVGELPPASLPAPAQPLVRLNLGCSDQHLPGYINVDRVLPADQVADLSGPWPWPDSSVDEIRAHDFIEHLSDKIHTMNEAWRVLKPGGKLDIVVPTTDGRGADQDPDHKSYWNVNSFWYYEDGNPHRERFGDAYGVRARFRRLSSLNGPPDAHQIAHLAIMLEAVKPPAPAPTSTRADSGVGAAPNSNHLMMQEPRVGLAGSASLGWPSTPEGKPAERFVAMLRVKNESRGITRAVESVLPLAEHVFVLDDHSEDDTAIKAFDQDPRITVIRSPFSGLDEARDKNFLVLMATAWIVGATGTQPHQWWMLNIDGDEELAPGAIEALQAIDGSASAYTLGVDYIWDSTGFCRRDGVYADFRRTSVFRLGDGKMFTNGGWAAGGLHCGNAPMALSAGALRCEARILHYGYARRVDRIAKYRWYNSVDPDNDNEDRYRHIIQGDGPARHAGETDIDFPDSEARLRWGGPLVLARLP